MKLIIDVKNDEDIKDIIELCIAKNLSYEISDEYVLKSELEQMAINRTRQPVVHKQKSVTCPICLLKFVSTTTMKIHLVSKHKDVIIQHIQCTTHSSDIKCKCCKTMYVCSGCYMFHVLISH